MSGWNFAEVWETVASQIPDAPAQVHGDRRFTHRDFNRRANGIAQLLLDRGAAEQDKVAQYLYNCPEYLESVFAAFKAGLAPVNTNYRYADDELIYLWDNADAVAVVFHGTFADRLEGVRARVPRVKTWIWVDDGSGPCPSWAVAFEEAAASNDRLSRVTTDPPLNRALNDVNAPVPCISGGAGRHTGPGFSSTLATSATEPSSG